MLYYTPLYKNFRCPMKELVQLIKDSIEDHRRVSETVTEVRDIVDFLRLERARCSKLGLTDHGVDEEIEWRGTFDIFFAAILSSSDTLHWALLLMAKHPEILQEVKPSYGYSSLFRRFVIPKIRCSEGSLFRRFEYSEGSLFRTSLFRMFDRPK